MTRSEIADPAKPLLVEKKLDNREHACAQKLTACEDLFPRIAAASIQLGAAMNSVARAFVLFAFMALLTLHVATGFLASFTEKVPRAVVGIDTVIQAGLISWLGHTNTLALLAFLTLLLPAAVCLRAVQASRSARPEPVGIKPARVKRMVDRTPKPDLRPQDRQLLANLLEGVAGQVAQEHEMLKANERPRPFVRLMPLVPIPPDGPPRSWFGGNPSLPEGTPWPILGGKPAAFLAQIDCTALPADLWGGVGPRNGWLSFFLGYENGYLAARILHTRSYGGPVGPPFPTEFEWLSLHEVPGTDWTSLVRKDVPKWPVAVVRVPSTMQDPLIRTKPGSDDESDPRFLRYHTGFDLNEPGWKPFDAASTLLMLDTATAHAREMAGRRRRNLDKAAKTLDQLAAQPERFDNPDAARKWAEDEKARSLQSMAAWEACLSQAGALRAAAEREIASGSRLEALIDDLITTLAEITIPDGNDARPTSAFPTRCPPEANASWLASWAKLAQHHATFLYAADPAALPPAWRAMVEKQATHDAQREMGSMRDVPDGYVHEFAMGHDVTLLQLPTSYLMNWIWGDTYDLVLIIGKADLDRGDFSRVKVQITN